MSFNADEEILQDFLIEAGEILEELSEQLVELENRVDDHGLLNAIFRGFHTVKGGAGFLQLDALVEVCHVAENTFDCLRNEKLHVDADLMDVVLQALDSVNAMFAQVHERVELTPADPQLLKNLQRFVDIASGNLVEPGDNVDSTPMESHGGESQPDEKTTDSASPNTVDSISQDINDDELASNSQSKNSVSATDKSSGDEITDDEFEELLDTIHGSGSGPSSVKSSDDGDKTDTNDEKLNSIINSDSEEITDDEFEALLDALHEQKQLSNESVQPKAPTSIAKELTPTTDDKSDDDVTVRHDRKKLDKPSADVGTSGSPVGSKASAVPRTESTLRVDTKRLDDIMNMVGELVLVRNRLVRLGLKSSDEAMSKAIANLDVVTADLQGSVMKTRMQPIKKVFGRFPRVVRDLARSLDKEVKLELVGEETDLDKNLVEALADPLVHLVRNSVDHGVEKPDERVNIGKSRSGCVVLSAQQEGDHIVLSITDDGAGMDADVLRRKAVEKGVMDQETADRTSDHEAFHLIFHPGFSTKEEISDVSGRGVGMDVVKTKINQLNGSIDINSELGIGTEIKIKVPLTLAIMPTLMVMLEKQTFALPLVNVNEIFNLDLSRTNIVDGQEVIVVREKPLPLFHLKRWLIQEENRKSDSTQVVIISNGSKKFGFVVDQLVGQEEVVIKPLGKMLHGTPGMSGATITGDGRIALILDVPSLLSSYVG